ncbi:MULTISPECIES: glycerol-3-phosphate 1-O-acyltransferase PlsY [Rhodobacterales]|jgi:glycerol-3-phosphate acyltransferase PlsY|uniref:glycerol-3-phosphate 1-O-acyltransferase PlsY n=1 Tax=Rhodobacterales TaxID=204455 RepID=UPI00237F9501|nr:glycerol-3-phosphate 1-O-acyltransferase PlsY [Phaeobacter gallaeciensis]MDE4140263.1 glycerol-3-phosphate 1-O-acyltransferase PlsY [Phaeobacter gallaeciensis]MDE4149044.1 glycerol-3-phosphate 1-O-acyltransferase PlsY [Phaeobacter gallaeciensis]MDE4153266.1 glycerol-3-phosphate 1-O-acyltransferase PlsY [Phaeobacter gallaeciensis]MDE4228320.1 glycerol-3-phosphate 1-O-acyltransferase PlsY [Phaeobacter gallaeciensis]MDE4257396.1 glycerol-3-phosphate 1-O-acyltransferase PlsY [Phaeobacter gallae
MPAFDTPFLMMLLWALVGYGLGSIPFGLVLTRLMGLGNLRDIGSGNIGTTNVLRTGSKLAALLTLLLDGGKGAVAVILARMLAGEDAAQLAGLAAFLGHCFPVWLGFKGGKGVATFLGLMLALAWPVGVAACLTWLAGAAITRMSSASALLSALAAPVWALLLGVPQIVTLTIALTVIVFWRHSENIARLRAGTEPKIGQK